MIRATTTAGEYVISSHGVWLPGIYATERAARAAFQLDNVTLERLSNRICPVDGENRAITSDDLRAARSGTAAPSAGSGGRP